jgi:Tfp pilus assembly protein PilE
MKLITSKRLNRSGFTFAEVVVAIGICVIFGVAAFSTNQRLLLAIKSQREATAATMMLQERMEKFRGFSYSNLADPTYVGTNLLGVTTTSEAVLPTMTETITVSGYMDTTGAVPNNPSQNQWTRTATTTTSPTTPVSTLATSYDLIKVKINISWTSADGRPRTREIASIVGKGNIGF